MAKTKNKSRKLIGSSRKRGTDGGLVQTYEQKVPLNEVLSEFGYGVDGAELVQTTTGERKLILQLHTHNERSGIIYDDRGRKIIVFKKTVEPGTDPDALPGTIKIDIDPTDDGHSEQVIWRVAGSGDDPDDPDSYPPAETIGEDWDDFAQEYIRETILTIKEGGTTPAVGDTYVDVDSTREIIDRKKGPLMVGGLSREIHIFTVLKDLPSYRLFPSPGSSFPAEFQFLIATAEATRSVSDFSRCGVVYKLKGERVDTHTCLLLRVFTSGEPVLRDLPEKYTVETPGVGSSVFRIPNRCIHPGWLIYDTTGILEIMDPSTPGTYNRNETLCIDVQSKIWKGKKYVTDILFAREGGFTNDNASVPTLIKKAVLAESPDGGIKDLQYASRIVVDGANVDVAPLDGATIYGKGNGSQIHETLEIDGYGTQITDAQFVDLSMLSITATEENVTVRAQGRAGVFQLHLTTNPVDGDTLTFSSPGGKYDVVTNFIWTFRAVLTGVGNEIKTGATIELTSQNITAALNLDPDEVGVKYGAGTEQCPLVDPGSATHTGLAAGYVQFTDSIKFERSIATSAGGFSMTTDTITEGKSGAVLAKGLAGSGTTIRYNRRNLFNPDRANNIAPTLTGAPTLEINFLEGVTTSKFACYVMDPEISISYEYWNGSSWITGSVSLDTVTGDDLNEVELTDASTAAKIRFLVTNSDADRARMLRLFVKHS